MTLGFRSINSNGILTSKLNSLVNPNNVMCLYDDGKSKSLSIDLNENNKKYIASDSKNNDRIYKLRGEGQELKLNVNNNNSANLMSVYAEGKNNNVTVTGQGSGADVHLRSKVNCQGDFSTSSGNNTAYMDRDYSTDEGYNTSIISSNIGTVTPFGRPCPCKNAAIDNK